MRLNQRFHWRRLKSQGTFIFYLAPISFGAIISRLVEHRLPVFYKTEVGSRLSVSQRFLQVPWEHEIWGPWRVRFPPILMLCGPSEGASTFTQLWGLTNIYKTSDCLGGELATDHEVAKKEEWVSWWQHLMYCWFCILSVNGNRLQTKERHKYVWHCILPAFYRSEEQPFCAWGRMWKPKTTVRRMFGQCLRLLFGHCLMENVENRGFCLDIVWGFC